LNVVLGGSSSHHSKFYVASEPFFVAVEKKYRRYLSFFIKYKWISLAIIGICVLMIFSFTKVLNSELAPLEDHNYLRTSITAPEGTEYSTTSVIANKIAKINMDSVPESKYVLSRYGGGGMSSGVNTGSIMNFLSEASERKVSQQKIYDKLTKIYSRNSDARVIASQEPTISTSSGGGLPVQFVIQNIDFDKLHEILPKFMEQAQASSVFSNVDVNLKFNKPELNIYVDRLKANTMGVNERDITSAIDMAYSGSRYAYYLQNNRQYYVIGQMSREDRNKPSDISSLYVRASNGNMVQLDNLIQMKENSNPPVVYHYNRYKSATVSANLADGKTLGQGIAEMQSIADKLLDSSFNTSLAGASRDFAESNSNILFALVLALLLIYLILAAQFESFRDPFIIMLTVPMAIAGAMLSLWLFNQTLNIFSEIGMLLLIGIVTKNGILIVEFANQKRKLGMNKRVAAFESASARFRPIIMTSLATIFGAMPIAFALGAGATSRVSLGIVVVCGLLFSLILTLFVIPVMYILMSSNSKKIVGQ